MPLVSDQQPHHGPNRRAGQSITYPVSILGQEMGEERHDLQDRKGTQPPRAVYFARMSLGGKMCREMVFRGQRSRLASSVAAFLLSPKNQRSLQGSAARRGVLSRLATCHLAPFTQPRPPPQAQALPCLLGSHQLRRH